MANRSRDYYRRARARSIRRKRRICHFRREHPYIYDTARRCTDRSRQVPMEYYIYPGQYSKGKIHCSCPVCSYSKVYGLPTYKDVRAREYSAASYEEAAELGYLAG